MEIPLTNGGEATVFVPGQIYHRRRLHEQFGGQAQGGISTPKDHPVIFLFTGQRGQHYGYHDGWTPEGIFLYTGEGQNGDMKFSRGNRAIRDHLRDGKDLHLFEQLSAGLVRYVGQMLYVGHRWQTAPDRQGRRRRVIVFELVAWETSQPVSVSPHDQEAEADLWLRPLEDLRRIAEGHAQDLLPAHDQLTVVRYRSRAIRIYAVRRANGRCEACDAPAPFITPQGHPYLESHHITRVSDGGPDHPQAVIALCPNCHRRAHYSVDAHTFKQQLEGIIRRKEGLISPSTGREV